MNKVWKVHRNAINDERVSETIAVFIYDSIFFIFFFCHAHSLYVAFFFDYIIQRERSWSLFVDTKHCMKGNGIHKYQLRKCVAGFWCTHNSLKSERERERERKRELYGKSKSLEAHIPQTIKEKKAKKKTNKYENIEWIKFLCRNVDNSTFICTSYTMNIYRFHYSSTQILLTLCLTPSLSLCILLDVSNS